MPAQGGGRPGGGRQAAGGPDPARVIPGGGVLVQGWTGKIDAAEAANGQVLNNSKLSQDGAALHVETGPATTIGILRTAPRAITPSRRRSPSPST